MKPYLIACIAFAVFATLASGANAQTTTRYVSDELFVPLRSGQGNQYRIVHRGLPSGTELKFIEASEDNEWSLVEMRNGEQGWIRTQYLLDKPTAGIQLKSAQAELEKLRTQYANLQNDYRALSGDKSSALNNISSLSEQRDQLERELNELKQLSSGTIELNQRYQDLLEKHQMLQTESDIVKADNERLRKEKTYDQWIYGASILGAGMIITLIIQGFGGRKRRSEWIN
ncbi:TIGR04211 family SH3 domain-containing protein [Simiduia agarivorans]|uniref:SH3 domain-containing protein n=1 Tax=Simiduia agarivorans (strain DSM 21679 / JCM 13881 / BCRC 17597 / SA1) TaxID=1117647 RepID=K4KEA4_SIMAS|nr:TIGR04211 family SH3 domain-containing protein [Simiduia agarivorans]AFU97374.2 SH3 domain-containing protein [Simiduia agarivorans SA1 = DSM 21679]